MINSRRYYRPISLFHRNSLPETPHRDDVQILSSPGKSLSHILGTARPTRAVKLFMKLVRNKPYAKYPPVYLAQHFYLVLLYSYICEMIFNATLRVDTF